MKKILASVLPALALIFGATGCSDDDSKATVFDRNVTLADSYVEMDPGATQYVTITDGNGGYRATTLDETIATAETSGNQIGITGVGQGKTSVIITDANGIKSLVNVLIFGDLALEENDITFSSGDIPAALDSDEYRIKITAGNGGYRSEFENPGLDVSISNDTVIVKAYAIMTDEVVTILDRTGRSATFKVTTTEHPYLLIANDATLRLKYQTKEKFNADATTGFTFYNRLTGTYREFGWNEGRYKTFDLRMPADFSVGFKTGVQIKWDFDNYNEGSNYQSGWVNVDFARIIKNDGEKFWMVFRYEAKDKGETGVIVQNIQVD